MDRSLLEEAKDGSSDAFGALVAPFQHELHRHCYRMLGSVTDADDLLQETMLAAWRGLQGFAGRSSLRTWLYRIATNRCLNAIRSTRRRPPPVPVAPFDPPEPTRYGDVTWLQPYPDALFERGALPEPSARYEARDAIRLSFIVALQRLPPRQTAALVLCDVLDFPIAEAAGVIDTTQTALKGLLQRARATLEGQRPGGDEPEPGSPAEAALAQRFADAYGNDDIPALLALLSDDAWLAMPPAPHEYAGRSAIGTFLQASAAARPGRHFVLVPTRANTQPAFACYLRDGGESVPRGLVVLTLAATHVAGITRFLDTPAGWGAPTRWTSLDGAGDAQR